MDPLLRDFLDDSAETLGGLDGVLALLAAEPRRLDLLAGIFRVFHTIKGTSGFLGLVRLGRAAHDAENILERLRDGTIPVTPAAIGLVAEHVDRMRMILGATAVGGVEPDLEESDGAAGRLPSDPGRPAHPVPRTVRVSLEQVDALADAQEDLRRVRAEIAAIPAAHRALARLDAAIGVLGERIAGLRRAPLGNSWIGLHRLVRDLAAELGKKIDLSLSGAELEIDRSVAELLKDPMIHLVRNAADHGLEPPAERVAAGKPETGRIAIRATRRDGLVAIELSDDGRGLHLPRIRARALAIGLVTPGEADALDDRAIARLVFRGGLSTASQVTAMSGRGIGLDVVRSAVETLGGSIDLLSTPGAGTSFVITIPDMTSRAASRPGEGMPRGRLLLIDESGGFRDLVEPLLTAAGYVVATASDAQGIAALRMEGRGFDLVLIDPMAPGVDADAAMRCLQADPGLAQVPVLSLASGSSGAGAAPLQAMAAVPRTDSAAILARVGAAIGPAVRR